MKCKCKTVNCYKYFQSAQKWCSFPSSKDSIVLFQIHKLLCNSHLPSIKYSSTCYFLLQLQLYILLTSPAAISKGWKTVFIQLQLGFVMDAFEVFLSSFALTSWHVPQVVKAWFSDTFCMLYTKCNDSQNVAHLLSKIQ